MKSSDEIALRFASYASLALAWSSVSADGSFAADMFELPKSKPNGFALSPELAGLLPKAKVSSTSLSLFYDFKGSTFYSFTPGLKVLKKSSPPKSISSFFAFMACALKL